MPEDLAGIVLYLASDEANWTTGQSFIVDGGHTTK
jgi:NAD(P)-dependent dehydrogenase (short-subunit alcohol dehydrogenase family)